MDVRIALFGPPRAFAGDGAADFPLPRKTLNVLAYVILNRKRPLARDTIAFELFADEDEERARNSLRRNLSYLLSSLPNGKQLFAIDTERIAWNPGAAQVDVIAFEEAVADGRDADALAEYAGQLLPTIYDEWTTAHRERLRDAYHEALVRTIARERSQRRFDAATAYAHRLLEDDPWREDVVRQLMSIRYEAGDRAGALSAFEALSRRLRDEMQAEPMPETHALRDAVIRGARLPTSEPRRSAAPGAANDVVLPFVGREAAVARARDAWHAAADGRSGVLFVSAEAGGGKSRFVTEMARLIEREGGAVVRGFTSSGGEHRPYEAIVDALRETPGLLDEHAGAMLSDDRSARLRLFESVRRRLLDLSHARPLAVILEDLHWAGGATIDLFEFVASRLDRAPVFFIATLRSDGLPSAHPIRALRRQLASRGPCDVTLERLSDEDAMHAARAVLPEASEEALREAVAWAGGLPLMLSEALRDVTAGRAPTAPDIAALVGERFARLSPNAETALVFGAVLGEHFDLSTLAAVTGWRDDEVVDAVGSAIEAGLVRATSRAPGLAFAFAHDLIRAAARERITQRDRVRAHGLVARALVAQDRSDALAAAIARHFVEAREPMRAAEYWKRAAKYALDVFANTDAREASEAGIALCDTTDAAQRGLCYELVALRRESAERTGDLERKRADARLLVELAEGEARIEALSLTFDAFRDDAVERERVLERMSEHASTSPRAAAVYGIARARSAFIDANYEDARMAADRAARDFEAAGDATGSLRAHFLSIAILGRMGLFDEAARATADLEPVVEACDDLSLRSEFHRVASSAASDEHRDLALHHARRALDLALRVGDRFAEARARQNVAALVGKLGDYEAAIRENERVLAAYRDVGDVTGMRESIVNTAAHRLFCGDLAGARGILETLDPNARDSPWFALRIAFVSATIEARADHFDEAEKLFRETLRLAETLGTVLHRARCDLSLAGVFASAGRSNEARRVLDSALREFEPLGQPGLLAEAYALSARLYAGTGDAPVAREHAAAAMELTRRVPVQSFSEVAWNVASAYDLLGDAEAARETAGAAAAAATRDALAMPADLAETYLALRWHREAFAFIAGAAKAAKS